MYDNTNVMTSIIFEYFLGKVVLNFSILFDSTNNSSRLSNDNKLKKGLGNLSTSSISTNSTFESAFVVGPAIRQYCPCPRR
mgnify:CR=1 FL=1